MSLHSPYLSARQAPWAVNMHATKYSFVCANGPSTPPIRRRASSNDGSRRRNEADGSSSPAARAPPALSQPASSGPPSTQRPLSKVHQPAGPRLAPSAAGIAGRQQTPASQQLPHPAGLPGRPHFKLPIVVEGASDRRAVLRAVDAQVYVLGGATMVSKDQLVEELRRLKDQAGALVLLLDADVAGRKARNFLEVQLPGCYHAFIPAPLATAAADTKWHEAGNIGVEHAPPQAIIQALRRIRKGATGRTEFSREELIELGLVAPHHLSTGGGFAARRELVCAYLGIGNCDGKQLLRQLNAYGFLRDDLLGAVAWASSMVQQQVDGS